MTTFTTSFSKIESLYVGYFGRAGDPNGVNYWVGQLNSGAATLSQIASSFAVQPEATFKYPYLLNPNISDPGTFVDQVFQNLFNHVADAAGKAYWVAQLASVSGSPSAIGAMILNIISGAQAGTADNATITNKVDVAGDFTTQSTNAGTTWNNGVQAQSANEVAATNDTAASVTAQKAATTAFIAAAPGPQSNFTLNVDSLTASAVNANFNAPLIFNAPTGALTQSLQAGDSAIDTAPLTGPGLSNGGTFTAIMNAAVAPLVTLKGIPTHTVTQTTAAGGYNGDITGLVTFNNSQSATGVTIGAAGNGIDKGGVAGTTTTAATLLGTVNINSITGGATTLIVNTAALAGAADALAINVNGTFGTGVTLAGANTVSVKNDTAALAAAMNGYETITINAAAAANIALADATSGIASTTKINVAGAGLVTLWSEGSEAVGHFTKLTTIDASTQTGGVTVTGGNSAGTTGLLDGNTVFNSFKGGTGADSLDISSLTAAQVQAITATNLDGGTGTTRDTLILATGAATTTVALNNSNFENIGIVGLTGTVDFSKFGAGVDTLTLTSAQTGAAIFNNLTSGVTAALGVNSAGFAETFNSAGTGLADVINVTHTGAAGGSLGALTYTGFETINESLTLSTTPAAVTVASITATASVGANVTLNLADASTSALTITGTTNVGVGGTVNVNGAGTGGVIFAGAITAGALNASTMSIAATVAGVTTASVATGQISILGSPGVDFLLGSAVADAVAGGAGADTIDPFTGGDVIAGGAGVDIFGTGAFGFQGQGVAASASTLTATIAAGETITFGAGVIGTSNVDRVTDFVSGTDRMDVITAAVAPTNLFGGNATTAGTATTTYVLYGNYAAATGVFTAATGFSAATADAIVNVSDGATSPNATSGWVVVTGLNQALIAADFV